ncbi:MULTISPECIES: chromosomal replication initiator protein DnaA [Myxococcus]|uniref:Chromosomal replication initiator protein DnaA n=1 Tax=Myxococcus xanthus TaxID=34 RepID=A0AAE6FV55_MYXXA|nr:MULTISPECIES: chromosomal replication initiator protein DnaA [Myxococcus]QDE65519.1 chromosomal replication initiator protein DnaA [Myxococcus xanthus]QDE72793.1 chromosomal replication initiator protein DnaA [Myxococcus xanthus]QDE80071.1 chromosomal replication initiator protein DnaA [Myxococcus xanthus]QDE94384.1 chromosomal replication initiator protein DnaA [Myxococcus xanthus]QDF01606.1 chromosomal replication initiator protein DnaA [Myxococcus xanthus]
MNALAQAATPFPSAGILWARMLDAIRQEKFDYALRWLERMRPLEVRDGALVMGVPDRFFRDWVDDHYRPMLDVQLARMGEGLTSIAYEVVEGLEPDPHFPPTPSVKASATRPGRLNARFTFDTFVVADSNQLPAAAAQAVADKPGHHYNPLYIYGGTGLGKTHLLQAVGNLIWERDPSQRVVFLSSEQFTNEYVESVREHRMGDFRRKFREECDVLLLDDIQFLGKREETQKEFFYTFNTLYEMNKAIVLTSDTVPAEIPGLEDRLRSRFAMGLMTDIREPTYETRVAILQKKAVAEGLDLPDSVAHFIAKHIQKNVRELEGALVKLSAVHSLTRQPVTEDFASQVLRDILPAHSAVDVESIQREVARFYKVTVESLKEDRRHKALAHARQVAMYLSRKLTKSSFPEIAARFSKDHSTVISAVRKVEGLRMTDATVQRELAELELKLGNP